MKESPTIRAMVALAVTALLTVLLVLWDPADYYLWFKALHILAVISWMAAMLYLPRLFVYHAVAAPGSEVSETFKVMERRLLRAIMNPAMIVSWIVGFWMAWSTWLWADGWFHGKLALVLALSGLHGYFSRQVRAFAEDRNARPQVFYRVINEVVTVLMVGIVILVVVKPF